MASVAAAVVVAAATVAVVGQSGGDIAQARFPVIRAAEGVPELLPAVVPDAYTLSGADRLPADPAERGNSVRTGRVDRLAELGEELVADFDVPACGAVLVTTASGARTDLLSAADRVRCTDEGTLIADPAPGTEMLYSGRQNSAVDDGLVLTYSGPRSDTVTVHLRRFGYPPELVGLRFDGETNRGTLGDKRVSITDTPGGRSIAWSFAPDT